MAAVKRKHVTAGQKRWVVTKQFVTPVTDWQAEVVSMLLEGSTNGVTQTELLKRVSRLGVSANELLSHLDSYRAQGGVQRFTNGRVRIWRATTKLLRLV